MDRLERIGDVVVICDSHGAAAETVRGYLAARGIGGAAWVGPHDADDVERAIVAGRVRRVIWPDLAAWLTALWGGQIVASRWSQAGVTLEFAEMAGPLDTSFVRALATAWDAWHARHHRRRAVAGLILSVVALAAAFVVLTLAC